MTNISRLFALVAAASVAAACSGASTETSSSSSARISVDCTPASPWAENVAYATGALVSFNGTVYECIQGHTSEAGWTPAAVPALWSPVSCSSGGAGGGSTSGGSSGSGGVTSGGGGTSGGGTSGGGTSGGTGGSSCDASAWVYMGTDPNACNGKLGEQCGWSATNEGQGYHCATTSWGTGCEPGGSTCPGGSSGGTSGGGSSGTGGGGATPGGGSSGGSGLAAILSESQFNALFPNRLPIYSYAGLVAAAGKYTAFATSGSAADQAREVAAFIANVAHETIGFQYVNEIQQSVYCSPTPACPCAAGQEYFGRGALQLSWNYNYCAAGQALGQDLVDNPGLVATDPTLAWGTGVWFWMTSGGSNGVTCHDGIASSGFGATIHTINSIECNGGYPAEMQDRVQFYNTICAALGVSPGANETC